MSLAPTLISLLQHAEYRFLLSFLALSVFLTGARLPQAAAAARAHQAATTGVPGIIEAGNFAFWNRDPVVKVAALGTMSQTCSWSGRLARC